MMIQVRALYPIYCSDRGVGHTCMSLCQHMRGPTCNVSLSVPATEPADRRDFMFDTVPPSLRRISCRKGFRRLRHAYTEWMYTRLLQPGDIAYLWPAVTPETYDRVKARGHKIVMERINCHRATSRHILDEAYDRLGWPANHGITDEAVNRETYKLSVADCVYCPSPLVRRSMLDAGIEASKLLPATYGWDPGRFKSAEPELPSINGTTVLFLGHICVRKGAHLLLDAWQAGRINGRLVLAGELATDIATNYCDVLNRPDIVHIPDCNNIAGLFASADLFAFPTLEEGSPLVSYEALASGTAIVTSPMGAGEVIRADREGIILDPYQHEAWVDTLRRLARDADLRRTLGENARRRAADFTWATAARRRVHQLEAALGHRTAPQSEHLCATR